MPPLKPRWRPQRKIVIKPLPKRPKEKSFFERQHYVCLAIILFAVAFFMKGMQFNLRESTLYGLWATLLVAAGWQVYLYFRDRKQPATTGTPAKPAVNPPVKPIIKPIHPGKDAAAQRPKPFITGVKPKPGPKPPQP